MKAFFNLILYKLIHSYVKIGLHLFYKNIKISGLENIPKNKPVLFVANHQNAMMDPILIATHNSRILYFLARASAFKNKIAAKLLNAIHAIAIYRVRDGVNSKKMNLTVFKKCIDLLSNNKCILIFPEGSHSIKRQIRSLRSGFTTIAFNFLEQNPNKELYIIPIGLNFTDTISYAEKVHIIYGKPILANTYFNVGNRRESIGNLIKKVSNSLKKITVHVTDTEKEKRITKIEYLQPKITNKKLKEGVYDVSEAISKNKKKYNICYYLLQLNSIIPFAVWYFIKPKIKQKEFISTAKFSIGLTVFPLTYILQTSLIFYIFGMVISLIYLFFTIGLVYITTKTN